MNEKFSGDCAIAVLKEGQTFVIGDGRLKSITPDCDYHDAIINGEGFCSHFCGVVPSGVKRRVNAENLIESCWKPGIVRGTPVETDRPDDV